MEPIDIHQIVQQAATDWPLSLRDDPTAFGPSDTWLSVTDKANAAIRENIGSTVYRALGKIAEQVTVACEIEIEENGGLADLDGVIAGFVTGLDFDTTPITEATDWNARLAAVRQVFGLAVAGMPKPTAQGADIRAFVASEPRLAHLGSPLQPSKPVDDLEIPASLDRRKKDIYKAAAETVTTTPSQDEGARKIGKAPELAAGFGKENPAVEGDGWDDEPAVATSAPAEAAKSDEPIGSMAELAEIMSDLGVKDVDFAAALGISRTYLSLMRKGERPWQALKPDRAEAVLAIVNAKLKAGIRAGEILKGE